MPEFRYNGTHWEHPILIFSVSFHSKIDLFTPDLIGPHPPIIVDEADTSNGAQMVAILSADHRAIIKSSFDQLMPVSNTFVFLFYNRLFECHPELRPLFTASIDEQGPKLIYMLAVLVRGIDRLQDLTPQITALSKRHVQYGVKPEHYQSLGEALIWAIGEMLGDSFTPDVEAAWWAMYNLLAEMCIKAAYE